MKRWQIELIRWSNYSLEALFLYVLIFPLYASYGNFPPVIPYMVVIITSALVYGFILEKAKSVSTAAIGIPIVLIVAGVVDFGLMMGAFLAVMTFWRAANYYQEYDQTNEFPVFLGTLAAGLIYFIWFANFDGRQVLLLLIFVHFLLAMGVKTLSMSLHSNVSNIQKKAHMIWIVGVLLSVGGLSVLLSVLFPVMQWLFVQMVRLMFVIGGFIAYPFIYMLTELRSRSTGSEEAPGSSDEDEPPGMNFEELELTESFISFETFFWIVTGIILLIIVYSVIKRVRNIGTKQIEMAEVEDYSLSSDKQAGSFWSSFRKERAPKNEIRRQLFQFQGSLVKTEWARKENETVADWMDRLPIGQTEKSTITFTYQKVRYGNMDVTSEEQATFKNAIRQAKKSIRENGKNAS